MAVSTIDSSGLTSPLTSGVTTNTITSAAATALTLQSAGTTAVTINTSQQVGIGTTSPTSPLQVNTAGVNSTVQINSTDANGGYGAVLALNNTGTGGRQYGLFSTSNADGDVGGGKLKFYDLTASATRMLIDSSGNFFVNQTSQTGAEKVGISFSRAGGWGLAIKNTSATSPSNATYVSFYYTSTNTGSINSTGTTTTYDSASDYRLKENIAPMTGALAKVTQLKPCTYTWKINGSAGQGFLAHELQEIVSDCVRGNKDDVNEDGSIKPQMIDTSYLIATLTAAIQELKAELDELKAKVNA